MAQVPEAERLAELMAYAVLDTPADAAFDGIVRIAAESTGCATALVSLLDVDRQWFKARCGLNVEQTPRDQAFCEYALLADAPLVVADATHDPRFAENPLVLGAPHIRFYAGFPLRTSTGAVLGTLCVLDGQARPAGLSGHQERLMSVLADQVMGQLELRRSLAERDDALRDAHASAHAYRALADCATDVVSRHLPDGTTLQVSPSLRTVLGYDPHEEVGRSAPERIHPDDGPAVVSALSQVMQGCPATFTARSAHANGMWRHMETRLSPVTNEAGVVVEVHSVSRDVSDRVDAEQRLRLSEERFRLLFDANPVGQAELSPTGVVQRVNTAFAELLGVTDPALLIGRTPGWITDPGQRDAQGQSMQQAAQQPGEVLRTERTLRRADGSDIEIAGALVGVPGADGTTSMLIGTVVDVSERNRAQRRLAELAADLQVAHDEAVRGRALSDAVLQTVGVGIVACDADGRLTLFNRAASEFHGLPPDPGLDPAAWAGAYDLYDEDGITPLAAAQIPLLQALSGSVVDGTVITIAPAGLPLRTVRCHGRTLRDPEGRLLGAVVAMNDITAQRASALELSQRAEYSRVLLETAHAAIWSCDTTGRPTSVNAHARDILGWPDLAALHALHDRGELQELSSAVQMLQPDGEPLPSAERPLARALAGEDTGEIEVVLIAPDRPHRTLLLRASPLHEQNGEVAGAILTASDVTALRASEARFRAAFHNGPTPVVRLDRDGLIVEANPALRRLTARRANTLVGRALADLVAPEDRRRLRRVLSGPGTGAEPEEVRILRADGTPVWCELATTVDPGPDGDDGVLAQLLDIDARKAQEADLERAATLDPLTGLANRSRLDPLVQSLLARDDGTTAGLLFIDLDAFKTVNDTHGHDSGDAVLVEVAARLMATVRPDDTVLRLGGDEFVVICRLPGELPEAPLALLTARLEQAVAEPIGLGDGLTLQIGCSIGVAVGHAGQTTKSLLEKADRKMYSQKGSRAAPPMLPKPR